MILWTMAKNELPNNESTFSTITDAINVHLKNKNMGIVNAGCIVPPTVYIDGETYSFDTWHKAIDYLLSQYAKRVKDEI